jgi:hypothetical protein
MGNERFIKFIPSEEALYLQKHHPNAMLLLMYIAIRARRTSGSPEGLEIGEAFIGDYKEAGIKSEMKYRTAKKVLEKQQHIQISETCRKRNRKVTTKVTTKGTKVKLLKSNIWDINEMKDNDHINDRITTEQRPDNDEQECKKVKNEQEHVVLFAREDAQFVKKDLYAASIRLKNGWTSEEIESAWIVYQNTDKEKIRNEPIAYITGIIKKQRILNQQKEKNVCLKKSSQEEKTNCSKKPSINDNEFYAEKDTSEAPLATLWRQIQFNRKSQSS